MIPFTETPCFRSQEKVAALSSMSFGPVEIRMTGIVSSAGRSGQSSSPSTSPMPPIPAVTAIGISSSRHTAMVAEAVKAPDNPCDFALSREVQSMRAIRSGCSLSFR